MKFKNNVKKVKSFNVFVLNLYFCHLRINYFYMKKVLYCSSLIFFLVACGGGKSPEMKRLENEQKALSLNTELNSLQMKLTQEQATNASLQQEAQQINENANNRTVAFSEASSAEATASQAKKAQKELKKAEKINSRLAESNKKIEKIQKEISKIQQKIAKTGIKVDFSEQNN
jgi:hypothetical protein